MKIFELDEYVKTWWSNIDVFYKKIFWIFFISLNVVYLYNSIHCLFGNEDVFSMFRHIDVCFSSFMGNYSSTWLEYFLSNKTVVPMFANLICFFFLSVSTIFVLKWLQLKKTMFNYLLSGLFILLVPFLQAYMWYRSIAFGVLMIPFFIIISFLLCEKIELKSPKIKKFLYLILAISLFSVFVLGTNILVIGSVFGLLLCRIFIDSIDNGYSKIKEVLRKYRYCYILILSSVIVHFIVLKLLTLNNILDLSFYNIKLITIQEIGKYMLPFIANTVNYFFFFTFPYVGVPYKFLFFLLFIASFFGVALYFKKNATNKRDYVLKLLITLIGYVILFYVFNIVYLLFPELTKYKRLFRLEYFTTAYFIFVCIVIGLKYANNWVKNIFFGLLFIVIFLNIQINMHIQKDQFIGQQVELDRVMTLKNLIMGNKNYEYRYDIKYNYIQIGDVTYSIVEEIYNANDFSAEFNKDGNGGFHDPSTNRRDLPIELFSTFQNGEYSYIQVLVDMPPRITNINPYLVKHIAKYDELSKVLDEEVVYWLKNEAKAYPSTNCVFINKGKIFVVMNQDLLDEIKAELSKK